MKNLLRVTGVFVMLLACVCAAQQNTQTPAESDYEISGVVVAANGGQPLNNATVHIMPARNREATQTAKTGADGHFEFKGITAGKYGLSAIRRGYPEQGYEQHEQWWTGIAVGPGIDSRHIVFRLQPEATIRGRITDEYNEAVSGAVALFARRIQDGRLATRMEETTFSDDRGYYSFPHLREGTYYLGVEARPWYAEERPRQVMLPGKVMRGDATTSKDNAADVDEPEQDSAELDRAFPATFYDGVTTTNEATAIDLQPGQSMTADFVLRSIPAVHLRISQHVPVMPPAQNAPASDSSEVAAQQYEEPPNVELYRSIFDDLLIRTDAPITGGTQDHRVVSVAPGHYLALITKQGEGKSEGAYEELNITGDMDLPTGSGAMAEVTGTAQFEDPTHPRMWISLENRLTSMTRTASPNEKGEFRFDGLLMPGKYDLVLNGVPESYVKSMSASAGKVSGTALEIRGSDPVRLSLKIGHGLGRIDGTALRNGDPCSGVMILLVPRDAENNPLLYRRDQSDSDGTFSLLDVVPGQYTLVAIEEGWRLTWTDPKVIERFLRGGTRIQVTAGLQKGVTVEVQKSR